MARRVIDALAGLLALLFLLTGVRWIIDPAGSAAGLGMPLLEGLGLSTQIGDFTSFFLTAAGLIIVGLWRRNPSLLLAAGLMLGASALFRILAMVVHGAAFAAPQIGVEVITFVVLLIASRQAVAAAAEAVD